MFWRLFKSGDLLNWRRFQLATFSSSGNDIAARSLKISGAKIWNDLRNDLKSIPKVKKFKNEFKYKCIPYLLPHNATS